MKHIKTQNQLNEDKKLNLSYIVENWRDNDTITREMILNIIKTMTNDEAADEIYEMINEICRYR